MITNNEVFVVNRILQEIESNDTVFNLYRVRLARKLTQYIQDVQSVLKDKNEDEINEMGNKEANIEITKISEDKLPETLTIDQAIVALDYLIE